MYRIPVAEPVPAFVTREIKLVPRVVVQIPEHRQRNTLQPKCKRDMQTNYGCNQEYTEKVQGSLVSQETNQDVNNQKCK